MAEDSDLELERDMHRELSETMRELAQVCEQLKYLRGKVRRLTIRLSDLRAELAESERVKSMVRVNCPACDLENALEVHTWPDSEGAEHLIQHFTTGELTGDQRCRCFLTEDQQSEAIEAGIKLAEDGAGDAWIETD